MSEVAKDLEEDDDSTQGPVDSMAAVEDVELDFV